MATLSQIQLILFLDCYNVKNPHLSLTLKLQPFSIDISVWIQEWADIETIPCGGIPDEWVHSFPWDIEGEFGSEKGHPSHYLRIQSATLSRALGKDTTLRSENRNACKLLNGYVICQRPERLLIAMCKGTC